MLASRHRVISFGQACVRIIEGADALLAHNPSWTERLLLKLVRSLCPHRLRRLFSELPGDMTDEILQASDMVREAALTVGIN